MSRNSHMFVFKVWVLCVDDWISTSEGPCGDGPRTRECSGVRHAGGRLYPCGTAMRTSSVCERPTLPTYLVVGGVRFRGFGGCVVQVPCRVTRGCCSSWRGSSRWRRVVAGAYSEYVAVL